MIKFVDLSVGTIFIYEGQEYVKIPDERINCCKVLNAALVSNKSSKIMVTPITEVETVSNND